LTFAIPNGLLPNCPPDQKIITSFIEGCGGKVFQNLNSELYSDVAIWGFSGNQRNLYSKTLNHFWFIDHGYFKRQPFQGSYEGYFRVTLNSWYGNNKTGFSSDKFESYNIPLSKWKNDGYKVVIVPPDNLSYTIIDESEWLDETLETVKNNTDRPIEISTRNNKVNWNDKIWCIVTCISNVQVDAIIRGVPAITTRFTNLGSLENIENPPQEEESRQLLFDLANYQWTLNEMKSGKCWNELNSLYNIGI